ncbi:unnamed protein product [Merluccius merluccius]
MANPSPLTYTWFFHQATHSPGWPNETVNNMLRLQPITRAHQGHYNCSATNTLGRGENSNSQFVEVLFAPYRPVLTLVNVTTEGNVITIGCSVESWPPSSLNLSWSSATDPSRHHLLHHVSNTTSLNTELNVTSAMAGRYTCRAQNSQGSNHSEQMLENVSVKVQPCCEVPEDKRLDLFCEARSVPAVINYTWTRTSAGRTVDVGFKQNLTIKSATPADRGGYRCSAENKLGSRESPEVRVENLTINPDQPGIYKCYASNGQAGTYSDEFLLVKKGQQNVVFWASPLVCIHVVVVNAYLVYRSSSISNTVYSVVNIPTGTQNYENLKEDDDDLEDIELNYCKVTFTAKQKTGETKKTTSRGLQDEEE